MTRARDLACRHCRAEAVPTPGPDELDPAEGLRLVRQLAAFGHPAPHLTGGDPLKLGMRDGNGIMFIAHAGEVYPDLFRGRPGRCEFRGVCGGSRVRAFAATGDPLPEDPLCASEPGGCALAS